MAIDSTAQTSRRTLLAGVAGGLLAAVAGSLTRAQPASAHDPDDVRLGGSNASTAPTRITNSNTSNGAAIIATAAGPSDGVTGVTDQGNGVMGQSTGFGGTGVYGTSTSEGGAGVQGWSDSGYGLYANSSSGVAAYGISSSSIGVYGVTTSHSLPAELGWNNGNNTGVQGFSGSTGFPPVSPAKTGVFGSADQDARSVGVRGASPTGRGGRFDGKKAQIRLDPSTATTHPWSGAAGDLFVDASHRLWFCKGGSTWKQIA